MNIVNSRRSFLRKFLFTGIGFSGGAVLLNSCHSENKPAETTGNEKPVDYCTDFSGLTEDEISKRDKLGYVTKSPIKNRNCANCNLWIPPAEGKSCGNCQLFKGPVYNEAHCTYWAPHV